ncbi:MAG: YceI family protein [Saprospiraceae bacterium]
MLRLLFILATSFYSLTNLSAQQVAYTAHDGQISFASEAPLELIQAKSQKLSGIVDIDKGSFAFSVPIRSLKGFNSPLQQEHFNENYMESDLYPNATFSGKLIDPIDVTKPGLYPIRAKGMLNVHGVKMERIIKGSVQVKPGSLDLKAEFVVLLNDHQIQIPKIVYQKIAEEINVKLQIVLLPKL